MLVWNEELQFRVHLGGVVWVYLQNGFAIADVYVHVGVVTKKFRQFHVASDGCATALVCKRNAFGTETKHHLFALVLLDELGRQNRCKVYNGIDIHAVFRNFEGVAINDTAHKVHWGLANKAGNEHVYWVEVQFVWRTNLLDVAVLHNYDTVGHCHSLCLVVGYVDGCSLCFAVDLGDFRTHGNTLFCVQVTKWFVHQEHAYLADDCATNGNTLALTTGKCTWFAIQVVC